MRLLYVTNGFPFPLTSGYLRHYHLLHRLGREHEITLLSSVRAAVSPEDRAELAAATAEIHVFHEAAGRRGRSTLARGRRAVRRLAPGAASPAARELAAVVGARRHDADAIVVSGKRSLAAVRAAGDLPMVVDICDATSSRLRGALRHERSLRAIAGVIELMDVTRAERALVRRADHLLFASARDRDLLLGPGRGPASSPPATVVPNGVDVEVWKRHDPVLGRGTIVFTGKMDFPPNEDGALRLCRSIFPAVRRRVPDAQLFIVGRDPTPRLIAAGAAEGITVTGFVDDVRPYLERATVFAAPLRFGAGIQNKLLEALAMEVPVVTSPVAAAGLRTGVEEAPVSVADHDGGFVDLVVERLTRPDRQPHAAGRAYVKAHFDWGRSAALVDGALRDAVDRGRRTGGSRR